MKWKSLLIVYDVIFIILVVKLSQVKSVSNPRSHPIDNNEGILGTNLNTSLKNLNLPKVEIVTDNISKNDLLHNQTELNDGKDQNNSTNTVSHMKKLKLTTDAVFRGFYVILALGTVILIYITIKTFRLRRHRAANRYNVVATKGDDQESFFPLAGSEDDDEDEEIFSASNQQSYNT